MTGTTPSETDPPDLAGLAGLAALGALESAERERFEARLAQDPELRIEVDGFLETAAQLSSMTAIAPPEGLRDRVLGDVARTRQEAPEHSGAADGYVTALPQGRRVAAQRATPIASRPASRLLIGVAAAVTLLVGAFGGYLVSNGRGAPSESSDFAALTAVLVQPDARLVPLGDAESGRQIGRVVVAPGTGGLAVVTSSLDSPPAGRTYELWAIRSDGPAPIGTFEPGTDGTSLVATTTRLDAASALAITEEPAGGSPQPTTPILATADLGPV